jgi:hypothetical protein
MYTERYLPKKYRDSRRRRRRNRLRRAIVIAAVIVALIIGGYFLFKWIAGGSSPVATPSPSPSAFSGTMPTADESAQPSASPAVTYGSAETPETT